MCRDRVTLSKLRRTATARNKAGEFTAAEREAQEKRRAFGQTRVRLLPRSRDACTTPGGEWPIGSLPLQATDVV
jgi:hypothetical protein